MEDIGTARHACDMRIHGWLIAIVLGLSSWVPVHAQDPGSAKLMRAWRLRSSGQAKAAIVILDPLVHSQEQALSGVYLGVAWNLLGSSWQDLENFGKAQQCYETAIQIFRPLPSEQDEYASAIDNLGSVQGVLGRLDASKRLREKAKHIYEGLGDHAGLAITSNNLAIIAMKQGKFRDAKRSIAQAVDEAQRTTALTEDDLDAMSAVRGMLAAHDSRYKDAISFFQEAIVRWTHAYGPKYWALGTAYGLLASALEKAGDLRDAITDIQQALTLVDETVGRNSIAGMGVQLIYAQILRDSGLKKQGSHLEEQTRRARSELEQRQCGGCTISVEAFR